MVTARKTGQITFETKRLQSPLVLEAAAGLEEIVQRRGSPEAQEAQRLVNKLAKDTREAKDDLEKALAIELGLDSDELPALDKPTKFLVNESLILEARIHTTPKSSRAEKKSFRVKVRQYDLGDDGDDFSLDSD